MPKRYEFLTQAESWSRISQRSRTFFGHRIAATWRAPVKEGMADPVVKYALQ